MKENSIEENIEILEKFKNNEMQRDKLERDGRCGGWKIGDIYKCLELDNAIDNILSDYKRVLKENEEKTTILLAGAEKVKQLEKENEELNLKYHMLYTEKIDKQKAQEVKIKSQVIPIQTIKDKIEEKEWAIKSYDCDTANYKQSQAIGAWQVLQELLEGRK